MRTVLFMRVLVAVISVVWICKFVVIADSFGEYNGGEQGTGPIRYTREFLLRSQTFTDTSAHTFYDLPDDMTDKRDDRTDRRRTRKRGQRGGVKRRLRRNKTQPPLPSMILSNVRSIRPNGKNTNFDELQANARFSTEFRDACVLCFSETWLCDKINDDSVAIDGFGTPFRTDRDKYITGEKNRRWCVPVREPTVV